MAKLLMARTLTIAALAAIALGVLTLELPARAEAVGGCNILSGCLQPVTGWGTCTNDDGVNCLCSVGNNDPAPNGLWCGTPGEN